MPGSFGSTFLGLRVVGFGAWLGEASPDQVVPIGRHPLGGIAATMCDRT